MSRALPLVALVCAACVTHTATVEPSNGIVTSVGVMAADSIANALITRALSADAALRNPDSTYSADAEVVANGELRTEAPRLAGNGVGGRLFLGSSKTEVTASFIWGSIEYRWIPDSLGAKALSGYATIIVGHLRDGNWRVVHLHSSTVPPPEIPPPAHLDSLGHTGV